MPHVRFQIPNIVFSYTGTNRTRKGDLYYSIFWGMCEGYATVICACLPRIYQLFSRICRKWSPSDLAEGDKHLSSPTDVSSVQSKVGLIKLTKNAQRGISPIAGAMATILPGEKSPL
jgi:hypothetical protein